MQSGWINGGFFVANYNFFKLIKNDRTILEKEPLEKATLKRQLLAFKHKGFWKCMDTNRDKEVLENIFRKKLFEKKIIKKYLLLVELVSSGIIWQKNAYLKNGMLLVFLKIHLKKKDF